MYKSPGTGGGVAGGSVGTLASTGASVGWWLLVAGILLVLGTTAVVASCLRNRRIARARDEALPG
nr:hypothetical protein [Kibdelosporangium sp. MJ126-NF4]CTQ90204.1 hypothetical protein [Kibdelosporangium sp. MJ126-NF4]